jgi:hypothetical protein
VDIREDLIVEHEDKVLFDIGLGGSVSDPYSFFLDPDLDPEVEAGDQYGSGSGSNPDPGL